jgi:uncharacterized membrane protein
MNPYDLHSVLHAKHAQHVVLIHFPIALFLVGVAFDFLYQWTRNEGLRAAAKLNLILAAVSTVPVVLTSASALRHRQLRLDVDYWIDPLPAQTKRRKEFNSLSPGS